MGQESELVRQAQQGDKDAFAQLYERYFDAIYRYIFMRAKDQAEAEDLTQDVFLSAFEALPSYKLRGIPFSSWLFRIAHNRVVDNLRKATRLQSYHSFPSPPDKYDPEVEVERKMELERVWNVVKELTPLQQEVISLRFAGGLSTAEIARILNKSEGAIKALQHSALVALRKKLLSE